MTPDYLRHLGTQLLVEYLANVQRCAQTGCLSCRAYAELYRREIVRRAQLN